MIRYRFLLSILPLLLFLAVAVPAAHASTIFEQRDGGLDVTWVSAGSCSIPSCTQQVLPNPSINSSPYVPTTGDTVSFYYKFVGGTPGTYTNDLEIEIPDASSGDNSTCDAKADAIVDGNFHMAVARCNFASGTWTSGDATHVFIFFSGVPGSPDLIIPTNSALVPELQYCGSGSCTTPPLPDPTNIDTRIDSVLPANQTLNATSSSFTFGASGYINPDDFVSGGTHVLVSFSNAGFASSQMVGPLAALQQQPDNSLTFDFPVSSGGSFNFSTSTNIQIIGDYTLNTSIVVPQYNFFGFSYGNRTLIATSTTFVVATSTAFGTLQQAVQAQFQQLISTASSTIDTTVCNPISGHFDITACMVVIFGFPSQTALSSAYTEFQNNVATHQPWGYFTRFFSILSYPGTSTLPSYTAYIATDASTTEDVITVDPGDMIVGAGTILNGVVDPQNGLTIRQIMEPFVLLMVALGVLFTILADLLGSHRHQQNHGVKSNSRV